MIAERAQNRKMCNLHHFGISGYKSQRAEPQPIPTHTSNSFGDSTRPRKEKPLPNNPEAVCSSKYKSTIVLADLPSDVNNQNTFSVNGGALSGL
jgi:hypothetical protein